MDRFFISILKNFFARSSCSIPHLIVGELIVIEFNKSSYRVFPGFVEALNLHILPKFDAVSRFFLCSCHKGFLDCPLVVSSTLFISSPVFTFLLKICLFSARSPQYLRTIPYRGLCCHSHRHNGFICSFACPIRILVVSCVST